MSSEPTSQSRESSQRNESTAADDAETDESDRLRAQLITLRAENRRLRQEYSRAKQSQHRRTAVGFVIIGSVALLGALLFPEERTVLLALGATGVFGAVLTSFLTPERFIPATVGELVYGTAAENLAHLIAALGLQDERIYVPVDTAEDISVRLFVPQQSAYDIPDSNALDDLFVLPDQRSERGLSVHPTGAPLFDELRSTLDVDLSDSPAILCQQVADTLVETFEIVDSLSTDVSDGQLTVSVIGSAYGDVDRFDHPIGSMFATALATQLSTPVELEVRDADNRAEALVVCRWEQ